MVTQKNVLHGDLSPNNLVIHEGKGYLIDFDHAKRLENNSAIGAATVSSRTFCIFLISDNLISWLKGNYTIYVQSHSQVDGR